MLRVGAPLTSSWLQVEFVLTSGGGLGSGGGAEASGRITRRSKPAAPVCRGFCESQQGGKWNENENDPFDDEGRRRLCVRVLLEMSCKGHFTGGWVVVFETSVVVVVVVVVVVKLMEEGKS